MGGRFTCWAQRERMYVRILVSNIRLKNTSQCERMTQSVVVRQIYRTYRTAYRTILFPITEGFRHRSYLYNVQKWQYGMYRDFWILHIHHRILIIGLGSKLQCEDRNARDSKNVPNIWQSNTDLRNNDYHGTMPCPASPSLSSHQRAVHLQCRKRKGNNEEDDTDRSGELPNIDGICQSSVTWTDYKGYQMNQRWGMEYDIESLPDMLTFENNRGTKDSSDGFPKCSGVGKNANTFTRLPIWKAHRQIPFSTSTPKDVVKLLPSWYFSSL